MQEIRNDDGRLVCCFDKSTNTVEIKLKDCTTRIKFNLDGTAEIVNTKEAA